MTATMTKRDRVFAALRGEEVDHVPVSAWWHDFRREWSPAGLAEATLEAYRRYDWDYIKVNPRATYYAEDWGARFRPLDDRQPELLEPAIRSADQLGGIRPLDPTQGAYGEQLTALAAIAAAVGEEAPVIQTVFSPLAAMSRLTGSTKFVQRLMRETPDQLLGALTAISETLSAYSRACLRAGADGIFYATVEWGSRDNISPEEYDRLARPFDRQVLAAVSEAPFNVLHVCRDSNQLERLLDYPVQAFHWDARGSGNPSLGDIAARTDRAVMGGVSHNRTMSGDSASAVADEARSALEETGARRFLLAPGCSIDPRTPEANLRTLVEAARA